MSDCDAASTRLDGLDDLFTVGFPAFRARLHHSKGENKSNARLANRNLSADQINETLGRLQEFV